MLDKKIIDLLNTQFNKELYSAYLYLDMADFYATKGLKGFQNWYEVQELEERSHAFLFRKYLLNNNIPIDLLAIDKPDKVFAEIDDPLKAALAHEQYVTSLIKAIDKAASEIGDSQTQEFLKWFIKEQVEEEENVEELLGMYKRVMDGTLDLIEMDAEMGKRSYSPPSFRI